MSGSVLSPHLIAGFIQRAFESVGVNTAEAALAADLMLRSDLVGADGHGVFRLPQYIRRILAGGINVKPQITLLHEAGATACLDGDNGLGHLVVHRATQLAIEKAKTQGVGWIGCRRGNHAGAASVYPSMVADAGLVGLYLAVGSANHMAPWGGIDLLLSTNPIAIAVPAGEGHPHVVLDMATTVAAYGKVKVKAQRGEPMPVGWMIDKLGQPLTDPKRSSEGLLLPIGDYKGYGLSLMIGLLAGSMNGAAMGSQVVDFNRDDTTQTNTGQAMIAINPAMFGDRDVFLEQVRRIVTEMHGSAKLPGVDRIRVPGEGADAVRKKRLSEGIPVPMELRDTLDACADQLGIARLPAAIA